MDHNMIEADTSLLGKWNYKLSFCIRKNRSGGSCILFNQDLNVKIIEFTPKLSITTCYRYTYMCICMQTTKE